MHVPPVESDRHCLLKQIRGRLVQVGLMSSTRV